MYPITVKKQRSSSSDTNKVTPTGESTQESVGVALKGVTKVYPMGNGPDRVAVNNMNIDFLVNEVTSLLGHNGAGKSTMMYVFIMYHKTLLNN